MRWTLLWVVLGTDASSIGFRREGKHVLQPLLSGTLKVSSSLMCFKHWFSGSFQTVKVSSLSAAEQERWGSTFPAFWTSGELFGAGGIHYRVST